ncbi:MAG: ATP-binding protein [Deltaproteobacteria bacterium]|nr:ATP-binding protein [Deltaproteobacteria bacterium]
MTVTTDAYLPRMLDLRAALSKKSLFLWGPRQTGKSSLIRHTLRPDHSYDLLSTAAFLTLSREPWRLREEVRTPGALVVIDEVQKLPSLLDEVQFLIEERRARVLLTGSSARKLRRGGVNLLGGRARSRTLHPLVSAELGDFDLLRVLSYGGLPSIALSDEPRADLESYTTDYLREEIAHEGLTRNIPAFSRFLEVAALCNGQIINHTKVGSDAQVARTTVHEYFAILRDTLIGHDLPAWGVARRRKPTATAKFYLFDIGVARYLQGRPRLDERSPDFGAAFEAWLFHELRAYNDYRGDGSLAFWRTSTGIEVDFILDEAIAIEVKAARRITRSDLKGLVALGEEAALRRRILVCLEERPRTIEGIDVLPYRDFLRELWAGAL